MTDRVRLLQPPSWNSLIPLYNQLLGASGGAPWLLKWLEACAKMQVLHMDDLIRVEREIESNPLEPQLSPELIDMMQREESARYAGNAHKAAILAERTDHRLRDECSKALQYIVDQHGRARELVHKKHEQQMKAMFKSLEKLTLEHMKKSLRECIDALATTRANAGKKLRNGSGASMSELNSPVLPTPKNPNRTALLDYKDAKLSLEKESTQFIAKNVVEEACYAFDSTPATFEDGEAYSREHLAANWGVNEMFTLRWAFNNQIARIESEWRDYLTSMEAHFAQEYHQIAGAKPPAALTPALIAAVTAANKKRENKEKTWLSKEKQEQLIHTAPILSPSNHAPSGSNEDTSDKTHTTTDNPPGARFAGIGISEQAAADHINSFPHHVRQKIIDYVTGYHEARRHALAQRENGIQWIHRQCTKMLMQVQAAQEERVHSAHLRHKVQRVWDEIAAAALSVLHSLASHISPVARARQVARSPDSSHGSQAHSINMYDQSPSNIRSEARSMSGVRKISSATSISTTSIDALSTRFASVSVGAKSQRSLSGTVSTNQVVHEQQQVHISNMSNQTISSKKISGNATSANLSAHDRSLLQTSDAEKSGSIAHKRTLSHSRASQSQVSRRYTHDLPQTTSKSSPSSNKLRPVSPIAFRST